MGPESPLAPHAGVPRDLSPWSLGLIWTQVTESHVNNEEGVGGGQSVSVPPHHPRVCLPEPPGINGCSVGWSVKEGAGPSLSCRLSRLEKRAESAHTQSGYLIFFHVCKDHVLNQTTALDFLLGCRWEHQLAARGFPGTVPSSVIWRSGLYPPSCCPTRPGPVLSRASQILQISTNTE